MTNDETVKSRVQTSKGGKEVKECARIWLVVWSVRWALLPVCFGESKAETGKSAHLTAEEVKEVEEIKEVASWRCAQRIANL